MKSTLRTMRYFKTSRHTSKHYLQTLLPYKYKEASGTAIKEFQDSFCGAVGRLANALAVCGQCALTRTIIHALVSKFNEADKPKSDVLSSSIADF